MGNMKAAVVHKAGGPEVPSIEVVPIPSPKSGEVLIRVKAFGLNRSELFTRRGQSPTVEFPRILGIEATGLVEEAPGQEFRQGSQDLGRATLRVGSAKRSRCCLRTSSAFSSSTVYGYEAQMARVTS
jgi:NADPH:quinone reductase-like Zn-dependent oxidoreductase